MATAKKCDICGQYYEWYAKLIKDHDLCDDTLGNINGLSFAYEYDDRNLRLYHQNGIRDVCPTCLDAIIDCCRSLRRGEDDENEHRAQM